jgi:hypothetical protein
VAGYFFAAALSATQRFFVEATMAALPAALSFRFGFDTAGVSAAVLPLKAAHLLRCPAAIFLRAAALIFRRAGFTVPLASVFPPEIIARISAIFSSVLRFCSSKPKIAALIISFVSLGSA